jgi:hypothetical protein
MHSLLPTRSADQKTGRTVSRARGRRLGSVFAAACVLAALAAAAQQPIRELLNSERIQQAFGSYGVEVLATNDRLRLTNLYSVDAGTRTCRTFAVVRFPPVIDSAVATEHAAITNGGSIGAVFAANVAKDGKAVEYAALVEIHHPEYLQRADLERIYGVADAASRQALLDDLLATAAEAAR